MEERLHAPGLEDEEEKLWEEDEEQGEDPDEDPGRALEAVEELLRERQAFIQKVRANEMSLEDLCKNVNEAKSRAEKERDELTSQIDNLKFKMASQSVLIDQLNEQVGTARNNVKNQREQLEIYLKEQQERQEEGAMDGGDGDR